MWLRHLEYSSLYNYYAMLTPLTEIRLGCCTSLLCYNNNTTVPTHKTLLIKSQELRKVEFALNLPTMYTLFPKLSSKY